MNRESIIERAQHVAAEGARLATEAIKIRSIAPAGRVGSEARFVISFDVTGMNEVLSRTRRALWDLQRQIRGPRVCRGDRVGRRRRCS